MSLFEFICFPPSLVIKQHPPSATPAHSMRTVTELELLVWFFDDTVVISGNIPSWMNGALRTGQDPERIDGGLTQILSRRKSSRTEDNHENPQESRCPFPILSRNLPDTSPQPHSTATRSVQRSVEKRSSVVPLSVQKLTAQSQTEHRRTDGRCPGMAHACFIDEALL